MMAEPGWKVLGTEIRKGMRKHGAVAKRCRGKLEKKRVGEVESRLRVGRWVSATFRKKAREEARKSRGSLPAYRR
jgi:hypothetical protein